jgi:hypothetical protein
MQLSPDQAKNLFSHFTEGVTPIEDVIFLGHLIVEKQLGEYFYSDRHITREVFGEHPTPQQSQAEIADLPQAS